MDNDKHDISYDMSKGMKLRGTSSRIWSEKVDGHERMVKQEGNTRSWEVSRFV